MAIQNGTPKTSKATPEHVGKMRVRANHARKQNNPQKNWEKGGPPKEAQGASVISNPVDSSNSAPAAVAQQRMNRKKQPA